MNSHGLLPTYSIDKMALVSPIIYGASRIQKINTRRKKKNCQLRWITSEQKKWNYTHEYWLIGQEKVRPRVFVLLFFYSPCLLHHHPSISLKDCSSNEWKRQKKKRLDGTYELIPLSFQSRFVYFRVTFCERFCRNSPSARLKYVIIVW